MTQSEQATGFPIRLSPRRWCIALAMWLTAMWQSPYMGERWEDFTAADGYRVPYAMSEDYWHYERLTRLQSEAKKILLIGDSVVWGEYVKPEGSLSSCLNRQFNGKPRRAERFANGGVNGLHPVALAGMVEHYTGGLRNQKVIVHCNLLWMSSPERDLQTDKELPFNHPRLAPQFFGRPPCYRASVDERLSVVIRRASRFFSWVDHLRTVYYDGQDLHHWAVEHPYEHPSSQLTGRLPAPEERLRHLPIAWTARKLRPQDTPWVKLADSLQWRAFQRAIESLRDRGNDVFVMVGPLNEWMLTEQSLVRYQALKSEAAQWLDSEGVPFLTMPVLASETYADASHPLRIGYEFWADALLSDNAFAAWMSYR